MNNFGIVGGILYRPINKPSLKDVYGEEIDLPSLHIYDHEPIRMSAAPTQGYQQRYNMPQQEVVSPELVVEATSTRGEKVSQPVQLIIPTYGTTNSKTQTVTENILENAPSYTTDILSGKEGFKKLEQLYVIALQKRGLDTKYAKWLAAQDALESGWGKSQGAKRHNYGNITTGSSWTGDSFTGDDHDAKNRPITQRFRSYKNVEEYIEDKLNLLQTKRYKNVFTGDVHNVMQRIFDAGYAVDPEYVYKIKRVYQNLI